MSKVLISLLILALFGSVAAGDCFGEDCTYEANGDAAEEAPISEVVPTVDKQVRRVYWYYLRRANLVYQANIDTPERFILFFIYRNIVGTFLCISSWNKDQTSEINTFVRLGNGYDRDIETPYSPVNIQPFIISLRLANGEYLIQMDENGEFRINGRLINMDEEEEKVMTNIDVDAKTKAVDEHLRNTYWYYLGGRDPALLVHSESILTSKRVYVVLTYVNIVGTFLVIGSCDENDNVWVNTFVRLGKGHLTSDIKEVAPPIAIKPAVIQLN